jgi:hypothetical protein
MGHEAASDGQVVQVAWRKARIASSGEQTMGSSCILKLVLMRDGMPVSA